MVCVSVEATNERTVSGIRLARTTYIHPLSLLKLKHSFF